MTAETEARELTPEEIATEADHHDAHADYPTPKQYWLIALVLGIITAIEVAVPYIEALNGGPAIFLLIGLGGIKFAMVVALFMHLRFDKPLYRNFFLIGLVGAIAMFAVVLATFGAL